MRGFDPKVTPWQIREQDFPHQGSMPDKIRFLLGYAILAPSILNTQPWQFAVSGDELQVFADHERWLKVADWDQRNMYMSTGCALENFLIAADHFGYGAEVAYHPPTFRKGPIASVKLSPRGEASSSMRPELFAAIPRRHTNCDEYLERPIERGAMAKISGCCAEEGILLDIIEDVRIKSAFDDLLVRADTRLFADDRWCEELAFWIEQGVLGVPWLIAKMKSLAVTFLNLGKGKARRDAEILMSSPLLAILSSASDDPVEQVRVGQVMERLWLMATTLGIGVHPMNQVLQVLDLRLEAAKSISRPEFTPQLIFRMGFAEPPKSHTPRQPPVEVSLTR
ncbi:MAG: nitroreductase family protein [Geobacteraceae bacterium]|nr:nitroreductase family protein [Geobacteraceae bacterium]